MCVWKGEHRHNQPTKGTKIYEFYSAVSRLKNMRIKARYRCRQQNQHSSQKEKKEVRRVIVSSWEYKNVSKTMAWKDVDEENKKK